MQESLIVRVRGKDKKIEKFGHKLARLADKNGVEAVILMQAGRVGKKTPITEALDFERFGRDGTVIRNYLQRQNLQTVGELASCTRADLTQPRVIGEARLNIIEALLLAAGYNLKP